MEYAAESKNAEVAEELLAYFLEKKAYDCFAACLFQVKMAKELFNDTSLNNTTLKAQQKATI